MGNRKSPAQKNLGRLAWQTKMTRPGSSFRFVLRLCPSGTCHKDNPSAQPTRVRYVGQVLVAVQVSVFVIFWVPAVVEADPKVGGMLRTDGNTRTQFDLPARSKSKK